MKIALIELENMEFYAFHGCYREEQIVGNRFLVDFCFETDTEKACQSDSVYDTVSYLDVYEMISVEMMIHSDILEHVAERIIAATKSRFAGVLSGKIKISKCNPPLGGNIEKVSVTLKF